MPHDIYGNLVKVGARVLIPATVQSVDCDNETYCNVTLKLDKAMDPQYDGDGYLLVLCARQVRLEQPPDSTEPPSQPTTQEILERGTLG